MIRTERANAKINLYLDVISKRENGYHDLVSIMQTLSLCDLVTVEYDPAPQTAIELSASGNSAMPCDCRNLAWRAAELFLRESGKSGRVKIFLEKHIPMEAGLAGGSTDAAAVLRALNHLSGKPFDTDALCALGARLGADVPFCIKGGTALVTGIGDGLEALAPMEDCPLVVAKMGAGISTVWAYGELDRIHNHFKEERKGSDAAMSLAKHLSGGDFSSAGKLCYNIFEEVVPSVQPCVEPLKETMKENGAIRAMMSGSGPSVFGVFAERSDAERACEVLLKMGAEAFVCHPRGKYVD